MKVADAVDHNFMLSQGYIRMGDYKGSGFETGRKSYYFSTVGGHSVFSQGIMQTVGNTHNGVDLLTGRNLTGMTGGKLSNAEVNVIKAKLRNGQGQAVGEALMPIFDADGQVMGYERSLAPEMIQKMRKNDNISEMIGAWAGRHVEEATAGVFNEKLIGSLKKIWDRDKGKRKGEFVNLADTKNNTDIQNDAWNMIPKETKKMIEDQFGEDGFMVRKDMLDNAVGYRGLSLGEAWNGPSNMSHDTKKAIRDFATAIRGKNAYRDLTVATKAIQAGVSVAKNIIVVTSIVIPIANAASNVQQMMTHGVSPRDIWNGLKTKLVEVERYQKLEKRIAEIQALKAVKRNNEVELRKLLAEEKSINDSISRMSIGEMIKAGEFTTIAEGELNLDAALTQGSWSDQFTKAVDRIPANLGTAGRYVAMSRDTAVFKGLTRSVQYGDFLAKSILYDHLTKKKKQTHEQAMKIVIDEFVAYNMLPSRERQAAEQLGVTWFWNYKLRSIKVAQRMIRNNPLRAMIAGFGGPLIPDVPGVDVGSPITDNAITAIADGRMGYSIGWGMLFRAPSMHPILGWMY